MSGRRENTNFNRFIRRLKEIGFTIEIDSRTQDGRMCQLSQTITAARRTVKVQLWSDLGHRVSHEFDGCSDTRPTGFSTIVEMHSAIIREITRNDSEYRPGGSKGSTNRTATAARKLLIAAKAYRALFDKSVFSQTSDRKWHAGIALDSEISTASVAFEAAGIIAKQEATS